jgi:hypothetical protein
VIVRARSDGGDAIDMDQIIHNLKSCGVLWAVEDKITRLVVDATTDHQINTACDMFSTRFKQSHPYVDIAIAVGIPRNLIICYQFILFIPNVNSSSMGRINKTPYSDKNSWARMANTLDVQV